MVLFPPSPDDRHGDDDDDDQINNEAIGRLVQSILNEEGDGYDDGGSLNNSGVVDHHDNDGNSSIEKLQGEKCSSLLDLLQTVAPSHTLRSVLSSNDGDNQESQQTVGTTGTASSSARMSAADVSHLAGILSDLITHRVDVADVLPATQDARANAQVMQGKRSNTLTVTAMQAARLYIHLAARPGAWASSFLELQGLTSLTALLRRWSLELSSSATGTSSRRSNARKSAATSSHAEHQPKKRSRRGNRNRQSNGSQSGDEDDRSQFVVEAGETAHELGFIVAMALTQIPSQREFSSWTFEAREALLEALVVVYVTSASLVDSDQCKEFNHRELLSSSQRALEMHLQDANAQQRMEGCKIVLRQLLPYVTVSASASLPAGEKGRFAAQEASSRWVKEILITIRSITAIAESGNFRTPRRNRRRSMSPPPSTVGRSATKRTPKSHRKKRMSIEGRLTPMLTSPALKRKSIGGSILVEENPNASANGTARPALSIFVGFFQKIATFPSGLEKARVRQAILFAINSCLEDLPEPDRARVLQFVVRLSQSKVSVHRLLACEWMSHVLCQPWLVRDHGSTDIASGMAIVSSPKSPVTTPIAGDEDQAITLSIESIPKAMFRALQGRLMDRIATVRARAASAMGIVANGGTDDDSDGDQESSKSWMIVDEALLLMLRKRALHDDSALVRKAAIASFGQLLLVAQGLDTERNVAALCELTQDRSVLTRTAAAQALTKLLLQQRQQGHTVEEEESQKLEEAWSTCVMPMVLDDETTKSHSKILNLLDEVLITPFLEDGDGESQGYQQACRILAHVGASRGAQGSAKNGLLALESAFKLLAVENSSQASTKLAERLIRMAHQSELDARDLGGDDDGDGDNGTMDSKEYTRRQAKRVAIWTMLDALVVSSMAKEDSKRALIDAIEDSPEGLDFCVSAWRSIWRRLGPENLPIGSGDDPDSTLLLRVTLRSCLVILSHLGSGLNPSQARKCAADLVKCIQEFSLPPDVIGPAISALASLSVVGRGDVETTRSEFQDWMSASFGECERALTIFVRQAGQLDDQEEVVVNAIGEIQSQIAIRALHTVGELTMLGFKADDDSTCPNKCSDDGNSHSVEDILRAVVQKPSKQLGDVVMAMLPMHLPGAETVETPNSVRAHAFTVLGKMCLRDEGLAKKSLNIFARELHPSISKPSAAVQSNALLVLGDLCIRYTNMVDRYLPVMALCLQSGTNSSEVQFIKVHQPESIVVRKHAILMLSSLLLQDYIKWRGLLFHRFLVASSDDDESVAQLAESVLSGPLWIRHPKLFFNHFVESIFVLNRCSAHPIYVAAASMGDGGSGIAVGFDGIELTGAVGQARRRLMYDLMLSKLSDEEKIGITARLAKEVLGGAGNSGDGDLARVCRDPRANDRESINALSVLGDAFYVLTHKSLKIGKAVDQEEEMEVVDPNLMANPAKQVMAAKSRLLSNISRKHLIEIVLPILCNLKSILQTSCSPLLKDLMTYLLYIFRNYKVEVKEFLASDPNLLQEIEYDARQYAANSKRNNTATATAAA